MTIRLWWLAAVAGSTDGFLMAGQTVLSSFVALSRPRVQTAFRAIKGPFSSPAVAVVRLVGSWLHICFLSQCTPCPESTICPNTSSALQFPCPPGFYGLVCCVSAWIAHVCMLHGPLLHASASGMTVAGSSLSSSSSRCTEGKEKSQ